jgi:hypothetical protein
MRWTVIQLTRIAARGMLHLDTIPKKRRSISIVMVVFKGIRHMPGGM